MSRADPSFAYAQARLQARYGQRPGPADWSRQAATTDLGALLQGLRNSPRARWVDRLGPRPDVHAIDRILRDAWARDVDEVADWQPAPWRDSIRWLRWLAYLPALQKLARGGRAPAWMRDDPVLGSLVAREPRDRGAALGRTALAPLAQGFAATPDVAAAWRNHWRHLWPDGHPGRMPLESLLRAVSMQHAQLAALPAHANSTEALASLERRLQSIFRRNPLGPAAASAYLGLVALDLRRVRGALATRALGDVAAA
jgi:hypothetical protein